MLHALIIGASATPPLAQSAFCGTVKQWIVPGNESGGVMPPPNATWPPGSTYKLCMSSAKLQWLRHGKARNPMTGQIEDILSMFNGTDSFVLTPNATQPGGFSCVRHIMGKPKSAMALPWKMVVIDSEATAIAGTETLDAVTNVKRWHHDRPKQGLMAPGNITWHLAPTSPLQLLRTSYLHKMPGTEAQSGERDFSTNFTLELPEFTPPVGVECHLPKNAYVPANDCKPACGAGALCCEDPTVAKPSGACYAVTACGQLPGLAVLGGGSDASWGADEGAWWGAA